MTANVIQFPGAKREAPEAPPKRADNTGMWLGVLGAIGVLCFGWIALPVLILIALRVLERTDQ